MIAFTDLLAMLPYSWRLMPPGPRKPVERHNGRVYWPTRDVAVGFVDFFHAPGRILGTQTFRAAGGFPRLLPTHTFRVAGVLQFTNTHLSGGQGVAFLSTHTFGRFLTEIEKNDLNV